MFSSSLHDVESINFQIIQLVHGQLDTNDYIFKKSCKNIKIGTGKIVHNLDALKS